MLYLENLTLKYYFVKLFTYTKIDQSNYSKVVIWQQNKDASMKYINVSLFFMT